MSDAISDVITLFKELDGTDLSIFNTSFLDHSIQKRITEIKTNSTEDYFKLLETNPNERETLMNSLQISFSEFFRNPLTFAVLERVVLPSLALKKKKQKEIRIWSVACASGQEAYSIAILLEELIGRLPYTISYRIFATDHSEIQIQNAQKGQFYFASVKKLGLKRAEDWLSKQGDVYTVKPKLKEKIDFSVFDLLEEKNSSPPVSIFGDFDLIICANLLFYYQMKYREQMIQKASKCLAKEGYFVTDEVEREFLIDYGFVEMISPSAIFQKE